MAYISYCGDCNKEIIGWSQDYYTVKHYLWRTYGNGKGQLCIPCLEQRMGRPITGEDILLCPLTVNYNKYTRSLLEKAGRVPIETKEMYAPIYDQLVIDNEKRSPEEREKFVQGVEATLAEIDAGTFEVTLTKNLSNPLRFWPEEYRAFVNLYRKTT